jgi:hypothetical protein
MSTFVEGFGVGFVFACAVLVCLVAYGVGVCLIWLSARRFLVCVFMALAFPCLLLVY